MSRRRLSRGKRRYLLRLCRWVRIHEQLTRHGMNLPRSFPFRGRDGQPISFAQWAADVECFPERRRVKEDRLPSGAWVSTVWLGIGAMDGRIFETMVFRSKRCLDSLDARHYSTEREAKLGHHEMVARWWNLPVRARAAEAEPAGHL